MQLGAMVVDSDIGNDPAFLKDMAQDRSHDHRWGEQTQKAIDNFPVSGDRIPREMIEALAMIKAESAAVNKDIGHIDAKTADAVIQAADEIVRGEMADQFPVDVFQTGSGTSTNMDGALVYSCNRHSSAVDWLKRRKLPLVYVDQVPDAGIPSINIDDRSGARAAAQHLVDLGHRRVGILIANVEGPAGIVTDALSAENHVIRQRLLGWLDALTAAGIEPTVAQDGEADDDDDFGGARALLDTADRPTAILCFSDVLAYGVVQAAYARGLDVPADLSVVGFDDNPLAKRTRPPLTTVRQDIAAKGHAAAAALTAAIHSARTGNRARARHVLLPTELVIRESTAKARTAKSK